MRGLTDAITRRADTLLTKVLVGVFVGKFAGDLAALYLTDHLGTEAGMWVGLLAGGFVFVVIPPLEARLTDEDESE